MKKTELLAPAGSFITMKAAFSAGADAVYLGGQMFGARAYANNFSEEELLLAIDYAHLRGKKIYLTVNTLVKDKEMEEALFAYLDPFYKKGLDAVIVQDFGVMKFVQEHFPLLPIHASTQMTITGAKSAKLLYDEGITRVVPARELSLKEIEEIHKECPIEIETFVHGALCYCYSGQCLFSSLAGGRSGNRGRCAQPCRMPYRVFEAENDSNGGFKEGKLLTRKGEEYVLSPKDMNTLAILPEIIKAGVCSLKIEGRMKKPEYTAGVVSIYRKYLNRYENGEKYEIDPEDQKKLSDLFNRNGFHESYYKQHNGKNMISLKEPSFREENREFTELIRKNYMESECKKEISAKLNMEKKKEAELVLWDGKICVHVISDPVMEAKKQSLTSEQVKKQIEKLGDTPFVLKDLDLSLEEGCFYPVGKLNELRRNAVSLLEKEILSQYEREGGIKNGKDEKRDREASIPQTENGKMAGGNRRFTASVKTKEQLESVLSCPEIFRIYADSRIGLPFEMSQIVNICHEKGKECFLLMPQIFRTEAASYFDRNLEEFRSAGFDGFLMAGLEAKAYLDQNHFEGVRMADHMLYSFNKEASAWLLNIGLKEATASTELNEAELKEHGLSNEEMIVYGYLPMMVTANCLAMTLTGCKKNLEIRNNNKPDFVLEDRLGNRFPVMKECAYCYNTIYNCHPLYLCDRTKKLEELDPASLRFQFTIENGEETKQILEKGLSGKSLEKTDYFNEPTRGHIKRGVL